MIRRLRARHRAIWLVLGIGLPAGLALALGAREAIPTTSGVARVLSDPDAPLEGYGEHFVVEPVATRIGLRRGAPAWLECTPIGELGAPDVLVYWSADGRLGADAILCGSLSDRVERMRLPDAAGGTGALVFYSTPRAETLAVHDLGGE